MTSWVSYRYQDRDTIVHNLNPFVKLAWVSSVVLLTIIFDHPLYLLLLFLCTIPVIVLGGAWAEWKSLMRFMLWLSVAIVLINSLVMYHGSHVLLEFNFEIPTLGQPKITLEAIVYGLGMALRMVAIVSAFVVLNFTIHPDDLLQAMIRLKLPYKSVLAASMSLRFFPALAEDRERIADVLRTRGVEFDKGGARQRVSNSGAVLVALLSNSLDRVVQIAEAMEARAFGACPRRTGFREVAVAGWDRLLVAWGLAPLLLGTYFRCLGYGKYSYYPSLQTITPGPDGWLVLAALAASLLLILPLAWLRKRWQLG
jgi:energy-coupling factor transport system permease protein